MQAASLLNRGLEQVWPLTQLVEGITMTRHGNDYDLLHSLQLPPPLGLEPMGEFQVDTVPIKGIEPSL